MKTVNSKYKKKTTFILNLKKYINIKHLTLSVRISNQNVDNPVQMYILYTNQ